MAEANNQNNQQQSNQQQSNQQSGVQQVNQQQTNQQQAPAMQLTACNIRVRLEISTTMDFSGGLTRKPEKR